jgi:HSP20 family protein
MSTLFLDPFDILFRDYFNSTQDGFSPAVETKITHPVNIFETPEGLNFEIACTGLAKSDVKIDVEADILRVSYTKPKEEPQTDIIYVKRGLTKKSFSLGYRVASRFNLSKAEATMENGLLTIAIPFADEAKPKTLKIK